MLSERITALYALLQCNNTEIARFAGCSSGNISKLKTGNRTPEPSSRSIAAFTAGVYGYADYENLLPELAELCGAKDTARETLLPALVAWLYETEEIALPRSGTTPKSRQAKARQRQSFGEKLDRAMTLLNLSNGYLASALNIDASLVSRYRSGVYSPQGNERLSEALSAILLTRAEKAGQTAEFAKLCEADASGISADAVAEWLFTATAQEERAAMAQKMLHSLNDFIPGQGLPGAAPAVPEVPVASRYVGTQGLREAVVRFLSDAAREGGELLLYSDEPMDWMSGDRAYFALWASLMVKCVNRGVKIRIIHNVDRESAEMVDAIKGWFPLYISGMIRPYVFRRTRNPRFCHTVFLRPGAACILGFFPVGSDDDRTYEYITEEAYLDRLKREYDAMLAAASPFLEIYTAQQSESFHRNWADVPGIQNYLLSELPIVTAPEGLLTRMLDRADISRDQRELVLSRYHALRSRFMETLRSGSVNMLLSLPEPGSAGSRYFSFALSLTDLTLAYTQEEYAEHVRAIMELVANENNFHLTLLPVPPFRDIQIVTRKDAVAVLRCAEPYAAFVFLNPALRQSVYAYLAGLAAQHAQDRRTTLEQLRALPGTRP